MPAKRKSKLGKKLSSLWKIRRDVRRSKSDDECDAYILARIAQALVEEVVLDKAQAEVIKKLQGR